MSNDWFDSNKDVSFELDSDVGSSLEQALNLETVDEGDHWSKKEKKANEIFKKNS